MTFIIFVQNGIQCSPDFNLKLVFVQSEDVIWSLFIQDDDVIMSDVIKGFRGHDFPLYFRFWILEWRQPIPMISWSLIGREKIQKPEVIKISNRKWQYFLLFTSFKLRGRDWSANLSFDLSHWSLHADWSRKCFLQLFTK